MSPLLKSILFTFLATNLFFGSHVHAVPYDYLYTPTCEPKPKPPQYNGGIAVNPEVNEGLKGYTAIGNAKIGTAQSPDGNEYAVVSNILDAPSDAISQTFNLDKDAMYIVSAWFQASQGEVPVQINVVTSTGNATANWIVAKSGCWRMLKGGFTVNVTEPVDLRFEANFTGTDLWVDSFSLQPFTKEEWRSHQDEGVEWGRKGKVRLEAVDEMDKPVADAAVSIKQMEPHFPFGNAINDMIIDNQAYQKWFLQRFKFATFENELKWSYNEATRGVENYTVPDAMLEFCKSNNITVRGHDLLWDDPKYLMEWLRPLQGDDLKAEAVKRVNSVVNRYKGKFMHWDVINENMHYSHFSNITPLYDFEIYKLVYQLDYSTLPFLNEYNVIENCDIRGEAQPWKYLEKLNESWRGGYIGPLGIGLEGHFDYYAPSLPYIRASLDMFATKGLSIWITEFDVNSTRTDQNQTEYIEPLLRELHAHPAVDGIIMWASLRSDLTCHAMCLTDKDYKNLPAGDIVDKFMSEYINVADTTGKTDADGVFEASLVHGKYEASVTPPGGAPASRTFSLDPDGDVTELQFKFNGSSKPEI